MATAAQQNLRTGQIVCVRIPQWLRTDRKLPSCTLGGTVGKTFQKAYVLENAFAAVMESKACLRCGKQIAGAILQRIGYCDTCADAVGAPGTLSIDTMEMQAVKKQIRAATAVPSVTVPYAAADILTVIEPPTPLPTALVRALSQGPAREPKIGPAISITTEVDPTKFKVYARGASIYVECHGLRNPAVYNACKSLGGGRWDSDIKAWVFAARPVTAVRLHNVLGKLGLDCNDPILQSLIYEAANQDVAMRIKTVDPKTLTQPTGIRYSLWNHQLLAYSFAMLFRGCGLFMSMGTGKSLVATALIAARKVKKVLIVCPKSVLDVWDGELTKHATFPYELVLLNKKGMSTAKKVELARERMAAAEKRGVPVIVVTNYETAIRQPMGPKYKQVTYKDQYGMEKKRNKLEDPGFVASSQFDMIIADEAHKLMHHTSLTSRVFAYWSPTATFRLALTGTPLGHSPLSIYGIYKFVDPDVFPMSFTKFRSRYAQMGGFQGKQVLSWQNLDELHDIIDQHSFSVTKDVLDLPPVVNSVRYGELSTEEWKNYREMEADFQTDVLDQIEEFHGEMTQRNDADELEITPEYQAFLATRNIKAVNVLAQMMKLSQVACGFISDTEAKTLHDVGTSKLELLEETLDELDPEEPFVVFARFTHSIQAIKERLRKRGIKVAELSGKANDLKAWQRGEYTAIVVQLQSGGAGIDLTRCGDKPCHYCIYFSKDYNWLMHEQSLSRSHRPGQTETTYFISLIMQGTIDETIEDVLANRGDLVTSVLTGKGINRFSKTVEVMDDTEEEASDETGEDGDDDEDGE